MQVSVAVMISIPLLYQVWKNRYSMQMSILSHSPFSDYVPVPRQEQLRQEADTRLVMVTVRVEGLRCLLRLVPGMMLARIFDLLFLRSLLIFSIL